MDDRTAQFLIAVGDLCTTASLASLELEVRMASGARAHGIAGSPRPASGDDEIDDSGYARTFRVDDRLVNLDDIVGCTIRRPSGD